MLNKIEVVKVKFFLGVICFDEWQVKIKYTLPPADFLPGGEKEGEGKQQEKDIFIFAFRKRKRKATEAIKKNRAPSDS